MLGEAEQPPMPPPPAALCCRQRPARTISLSSAVFFTGTGPGWAQQQHDK